MMRGAAIMMVAGFLAAAAMAQSDTVVMAERQPLAARSLLLDIMRLPGGGFIAVGERGHVVLSEDGDQWRQAETVPTRSTLTAVAHDGERLWAAGHDTVIINSDDGGMTWERVYFDPDRQQPILDIAFSESGRGFAVGAYGLMLVTDDGGENWEDGYVSDEEWHLNALLDLGDGHLLMAGEAGYGYSSMDDGDNWDIIEMPYPGSMFGVAEAGDCLLMFGLRGNAQESCGGSEDWEEIVTGTDSSLSAASLVDGAGILVGNTGVVVQRDATGRFQAGLHSSGVDFAAVVHLDAGRWLLVGEDGVHRYPERAGAAQ